MSLSRCGGLEVSSHQSLQVKQIRNQASRKIPVLTLIETNAISAPVVSKNISVDPAEALSHSVHVPSVDYVKIRDKSQFDILF